MGNNNKNDGNQLRVFTRYFDPRDLTPLLTEISQASHLTDLSAASVNAHLLNNFTVFKDGAY